MNTKHIPGCLIVFILIFFLVRNLSLSSLLPLWVFGDEMAHADYVLKLSRGHLPDVREFIEPELFALHKDKWDSRYLTKAESIKITELEELGMGAYSYQANHPPLYHLILTLFQKVFSVIKLPLLQQIRLLRSVSLLAILGGLLLIFFSLKKTQDLSSEYLIPLLCIPLLAQDMYIAINNDVYSFLFGSMFIAGLIRLYNNPISLKNWMWLSLGLTLALWTKLSNIYFLGLWILFTLFLILKHREKKLWIRSSVFLILTCVLSSPWYIYCQWHYGSFWRTINAPDNLGVAYTAHSASFSSLWSFLRAFTRTFFRGEILWNGSYMDAFPEWLNDLALTLIPIFLVIAAIVALFKLRTLSLPLGLAGIAVLGFFLFGHFFIGGIPFYHARFSLGGLYCLMFLLVLGGKKVFRSERLSFQIIFACLLFYNILYTSLLLVKVL